MIHELKIDPRFFDAVASGIKPFEVRKNDRDFKVGDLLKLNEYVKPAARPADPLIYNDSKSVRTQIKKEDRYTGRFTYRYITYVLDDPEYCPDGYVILGLGNASDK